MDDSSKESTDSSSIVSPIRRPVTRFHIDSGSLLSYSSLDATNSNSNAFDLLQASGSDSSSNGSRPSSQSSGITIYTDAPDSPEALSPPIDPLIRTSIQSSKVSSPGLVNTGRLNQQPSSPSFNFDTKSSPNGNSSSFMFSPSNASKRRANPRVLQELDENQSRGSLQLVMAKRQPSLHGSEHEKEVRSLDSKPIPELSRLRPASAQGITGLPRLPNFSINTSKTAQFDKFGRKNSSPRQTIVLVTLCTLFPPLWLFLGAGYFDSVVGPIPRWAKFLSLGLVLLTLAAGSALVVVFSIVRV